MTVVQDQIQIPVGVDYRRVRVSCRLTGEDRRVVNGTIVATGVTTTGIHTTGVDASGNWSLNVDPTDDGSMLPSGVVYLLGVSGLGVGTPLRYFHVPVSGGPYNLEDVEVDAPGAIGGGPGGGGGGPPTGAAGGALGGTYPNPTLSSSKQAELDAKATASALATEVTNRTNADNSEASTRASADTALATSVTNEASARSAADTTLQTNIGNEATARSSADTTLQTNITNEATARGAADTTLQTNITAEATARSGADTAEATARGNADTAESAARIAGDAALMPRLPDAGLKTTDFTALPNTAVRYDTSGAARTCTLPSTGLTDGDLVHVKLVIAGNTLTIALTGGAVINRTGGVTSTLLNVPGEGKWFKYVATGNIWEIIGTDVPTSMLSAPVHGQAFYYDANVGALVPGARQVNDNPYVAPLVRWQTQVAGAATGKVKVLFSGDSEVEYAGIANPAIARISSILNRNDRTLTPGVGQTWFPGSPQWGIGGNIPAWTQTGGVTSAQRQATRGLAGCAMRLTDTQSVTLPAGTISVCEAITFYWVAGAGGSTIDLQVDGVTVQTVSGATSGSYTATGLSEGQHSCGFVSHGITFVDFVQFWWGNQTAGLVPYVAGKSSMGVKDAVTWTDFAAYITSINPDLVVLSWGINDWGDDPTGVTWRNNMSTLIDTIRGSSADVSIVVWLPSEVFGHSPWAAMSTQARRLATLKNVALADASGVMPSMASVDTYTISLGDKIHYSAKGCTLMSNVLLDVIAGWMRDVPGVDATGGKAATGATWRDPTLSGTGHYPIAKVRSSGSGVVLAGYVSEDDLTGVAWELGQAAAGFLPGYFGIGPGTTGTTPDTILYRKNKNAFGIFSAGLASVQAAFGSVNADVNSTAVTTEQDLLNNSTAIPANVMNSNGDVLELIYYGVTANNARTKAFTLYFAGTSIGTTGTLTYAGSPTDTWEVRATITRRTGSTASCSVVFTVGGTSTTIKVPILTQLTGLTWANAQSVRLTTTVGAGAAASDVTLRAGKIKWAPA